MSNNVYSGVPKETRLEPFWYRSRQIYWGWWSLLPLITNAGKAIPYVCPVCSVDLPSGMALYHHLWSTHPHEKPYQCHDFGARHNNLKELSFHHSNVHWPKAVSCKECDYTSTSKAKLWQHVHHHTQGLMCVKCSKAFPTWSELKHHERLHGWRDTYECDDCQAEYFTLASLHIHKVGKHGCGYICAWCKLHFDTPSQRIWHKKMCLVELDWELFVVFGWIDLVMKCLV